MKLAVAATGLWGALCPATGMAQAAVNSGSAPDPSLTAQAQVSASQSGALQSGPAQSGASQTGPDAPAAPVALPSETHEREKQRLLRPLLPRLILAAEHHQQIPWPKGSPHHYIPELHTLTSMIAARDREAAT